MTKIVGANMKKFGNGRQFWDDNISVVGCLTLRTLTNRLVFENRIGKYNTTNIFLNFLIIV